MTKEEIKKINELIAEKIMGLQPQIDFGTWPEHDWQLDEDGEIDEFVLDVHNHNGPGCNRCYYSYCHHCLDGPDEPCEKKAPDYAGSISTVMQVIDKLKEKYIVEIEIDRNGVECRLLNEYLDNEDESFTALATEGDTIPIAVCLAALKSIE